MAERRPDVLVVGAGVIGLSTGICLAEAGLRVRVRAREVPGVTSRASGAMIGPAMPGTAEPAASWEHETIREMTGLAASPETGVRMTSGLMAARPTSALPPDAAPPESLPPMPRSGDDAEPGSLRPCAPEELPGGFNLGFWATVPMVEMPRYLSYLTERFQGLGGEIQTGAVGSLAEAAREAPLVANCAGIGARDLAGDPELRPVRGQHVIVENPGIDTFFVEAPFGPAWASWFPHGDHLVLGGVAEEDDWRLEPDPAVAGQILARCAELEPRLGTARVIEHRVGLRPARPTVRLETEEVAGARVVHDYGHGGMGVTLSWGCARAATRLLTEG